MRCVRLSDIFRQKSTSRAKEPVGNYSYRTRSRSVRNPSRCFAKRYSFGQSVGTSCKTTLLPSYTKCFFSSIEVHVVAWLAQREDSRGEFQDGTLGGGGGGVLSTPTNSKNFGKYCSIIRKIDNYFNASIGRVETGCDTATTTQ